MNSESNNLEKFTKVCYLSDLPEKSGRRFLVNDVDVALFRINGNVYALSNICPHQHSALIYDGFIEEDYVYCPAHGWEFNIMNGKMKDGRKGLDAYPVIVYKGEVYVKAERKSLNW